MGEHLIAGFVIGLAICVSSTVVIVRVLADQGILHTKQGHIVIGWTIVEDLISVFGLLLLPSLASVSTSGGNQVLDVLYPILWVLLKIVILGLLFYFAGKKLIEMILKVVARAKSHELFTLAILSITFSIAIASSYIFGISLALGAFIAGTIVGGTDMSHQAAANALPMKDAFAVIFFLSVGMLFSPFVVFSNLPLFFGILMILLVLRPLLAFLIIRMANYPAAVAFAVALAISQIGEYSFILAEEGSSLRILPDNAYDILVACSFVTIGVNPILFHFFGPLCNKHLKAASENEAKEISKELMDAQKQKGSSFLPRVIVIGFGPVGQDACKYLLARGYHVLIIDQNIDTISSLKDNEIETIFGDAAQVHILEKGQIDNACLVVITIPDYIGAQSIIQAVREITPFVPIIARAHFKADLKSSGADDISAVCDEEAVSEKLIATIRRQLKHAS